MPSTDCRPFEARSITFADGTHHSQLTGTPGPPENAGHRPPLATDRDDQAVVEFAALIAPSAFVFPDGRAGPLRRHPSAPVRDYGRWIPGAYGLLSDRRSSAPRCLILSGCDALVRLRRRSSVGLVR